MSARAASLAAMALFAVSCGGGGGGDSTDNPTEPSGIVGLLLEADQFIPAMEGVTASSGIVEFAAALEGDAAQAEAVWTLDGKNIASGSTAVAIDAGKLEAGTHAVELTLARQGRQSTIGWRLHVPSTIDGSEAVRDRPPSIVQALPPGPFGLRRGETTRFRVVVEDVDMGASAGPRCAWSLDGEARTGSSPAMELATGSLALGEHEVQVTAFDGAKPGSDDPVHVWRFEVHGEDDATEPYIAEARPVGDARLSPESSCRFRVEVDAGNGGLPLECAWEVDGILQPTKEAWFDFEPMSAEMRLSAGSHRVTCGMKGDRVPNRGRVGWTITLDDARSEPASEGDTPPAITSAEPESKVRAGTDESRAFRVVTADPEGDIVTYAWTVDGVLQPVSGPIFVHSRPSDSASSRVEVRIDDGRGDGVPDDASARALWTVSALPLGALALSPTTGAVIVDDGQTGTTATGIWIASGAAQPYGSRSVYSRSAGASYAFRIPVTSPGRYDVLLWWTAWPSRSSAVPVTIEHASGSAKVKVDQLSGGGRWNLLGTYDFQTSGRIIIYSESSTYSTSADAACLSPVSGTSPDPGGATPAPAGVEFVIDDGTPGTSSVGSWSASSAPSPYGGRSLYAKNTGSYVFSRPLASPGTYDVYAWWTAWPSREPQAPYDIVHSQGTTTVRVDQRSKGGQWNYLGRFPFGSSAKTTLRVTGTTTFSADAIRFTPATGTAPGTPNPTPVTLSWTAPTRNSDGTTLRDLAGYRVYWGTSRGKYSQVREAGSTTRYTISTLDPGTYYFAVTALDASGNESTYSSEVSKTLP